jgi:hypothetical protein
MENSCGKIKERLSAYLDGQLPSDQMAEVAAHLGKCPSCSAFLEKMRQLDDMAAGVSPEFDDALLDNLSDRINSSLENIEQSEEGQSRTKTGIIPVWHRYVAVAASVAFVFFAGRLAFKDTGFEFGRQGYPPRPSQMSSPRTTPKQLLESDKVDEREEIPKAETADDMLIEADAVSEEKQNKQSRLKTLPEKDIVADETIDKGMDKTPRDPVPAIVEEAEAVSSFSKEHKVDLAAEGLHVDGDRSDAQMKSNIYGKITDRESGKSLVGVAVQLEGTDLGGMTDFDGNFVVRDVPPDTYNLVYSAMGYYAERIDGIQVSPESNTRADAAIEMLDHSLSMRKFAPPESPKEGISFNSTAAVPSETTPDQEDKRDILTIDSLEVLYGLAMSDISLGLEMREIDAAPVKSSSEMRVHKVQALLDSVESIPQREALYARLENLYFMARANYDLYRQTRDNTYLDRAGQYKDRLNELIDEYLEMDEGNKVLQDYKAELERWRF